MADRFALVFRLYVDDYPAPVTPERKYSDQTLSGQEQMDVNVIEGTINLHIRKKKCFRVSVSLERQIQETPDTAVCPVATYQPGRFKPFFESSGVSNDRLNRIGRY